MINTKPGRNDPCPCGSGKKHKRCCLAKKTLVCYETPKEKRRRVKPLIPNLDLLLLAEPERAAMREAADFNAFLMDFVRAMIEPGVNPKEIDEFVRTFTQDHGHVPACLGYAPEGLTPFPASCCISPNHVVCHGNSLNQQPLQEGDIVNVDLTTIVDGWHGDQSETFLIGEVSDQARRLTQAAFDSMWAAIDALIPYARVSVIGKKITALAHANDFSVVEAFTGHGVGRHFHNDLAIPHYPTKPALLTKLPPGITFTIEPMINAGLKDVVVESDGWTATTVDGSLSAQFEHTILMTENGPEVLTLTKHGPQRGHRF